MDLFEHSRQDQIRREAPLAARMRPRSLDEFIGQKHVVRAINFIFEDSVEFRVREVLEEKLAVIFDEFGIDKTGDVLDSAEAEQLFDVHSIVTQYTIPESLVLIPRSADWDRL